MTSLIVYSTITMLAMLGIPKLVICLALTIAAADCAALRKEIDVLAASLERDFINNPVHVGFSIGIVAKGKQRQIHFDSVGRRRAVAPTGHTIYELASLTKTYTGMLLAPAVVDGKIALDDDVRRYLPPGFANLAFNGQPIRPVVLASHTAGLPKNLPAFPTGFNAPFSAPITSR